MHHTQDGKTKIMIIVPETEHLFDAIGDYRIDNITVANSNNEISSELATSFTMDAAFPNPFNPSTSFEINAPYSGNLSIYVYNLMGQKVSDIYNGVTTAGPHNFIWDGTGLSSGVYIIHAVIGSEHVSQKVMLLK